MDFWLIYWGKYVFLLLLVALAFLFITLNASHDRYR